MLFFNGKIQSSESKQKVPEFRLKGRTVSRGLAFGKVICLHGLKRQFYRIELKSAQIEQEIKRFHEALRLAKSQITKITSNEKNPKASIFETHLLILKDNSLISKIENHIKEEKVNSEWAVKIVTDEYIFDYKAIADEHLRERYIDLEDIAERLQSALGGASQSNEKLEKNLVIVAREVKPSTIVELIESQPQAVITEVGGWTSHTFILARELYLPAVTGVSRLLRRIHTGDQVIVDAFSGQIIVHPNKDSTKFYNNAANSFKLIKTTETLSKVCRTLDGKHITLRANLDIKKDYAAAKKLGAEGIGLFRSEYLFNQYQGFPSEKTQIKEYSDISKTVGEKGVRIRTFDLGAEHLSDAAENKEKNPALGLRAIRLSFEYLKEFKIQIRSLLIAAALENNISVILPMISDVADIRKVKRIIQQEKRALRKKESKFGELKVGAMIEVPSAILTIDDIAAESDFMCIGTNDLVQYLLAVDRDNEKVADWFRTLHPSVLRAIKMIIEAGEKAEIPVIVCGEMAGSPIYVPILIGLGVTEMSMNTNSIARVRKIISNIAFEEAEEIVRKLQACKTHRETEKIVNKLFTEKWLHLFPENSFRPQIKN